MAKKRTKSKGKVTKLDTHYFSKVISELDSAVETFEESLKIINRQTELLQDSWDGSGAKKFDNAYKRLKKEFDDQSETLYAIKEDLKVILETYEGWDTELKTNIAGNSISE